MKKLITDPNLGLDENSIGKVRFGRNRFLQLTGAVALGVALPSYYVEEAEAAVYPCTGPRECSCCYRDACCGSGCVYASDYCGGTSCWTATANGVRYRCCDWYKNGQLCICKSASTVG